MIEQFESIIFTLLRPKGDKDTFSIFDPTDQLDEERTDGAGIAQALNAAFLITLAGSMHPALVRAERLLAHMVGSSEWADIARFYLNGVKLIHQEIESVCRQDPIFKDRLKTLFEWVSDRENLKNSQETVEKIWSVFFPEARGIRAHKQGCIKALREKRTVTITELNTTPITDPARQILFTSNVLLTIPASLNSPDELPFSDDLTKKLPEITSEPQLYWYDHPIRVGVEPEKNEVLYGIRGLEEAFDFERDCGNMPGDAKPICVLSISTTHRGLQDIAKRYLEKEFLRSSSLKNIDVYVFTEVDTQRITDEILVPAALHYLEREDARELLCVFGVDGDYGRHYSFLKAIAAFWSVFIQPEISATFKIDLDQVFPQKELVGQTGGSAFEHFKTPLWGAHCLDSKGEPLELGMIAGALVNERDIGKSLFTPDVQFPDRVLSPDEYIFFSALPQALSTEAEMMTLYTTDRLDGKRTCIQRIHVTGGTNGILVDSLRRHRPFTPSFIGRAEDQAYILSVLPNPGTKLAYVHKDGLIMRHDKDVLAQGEKQPDLVAKLVGDYLRILYFSAYARALTDDVSRLKDTMDQFTGCFISRIPTTVVYLRFGLKAAWFFAVGKEEQGLEFLQNGSRRLHRVIQELAREPNPLIGQVQKEREGWNLFYDILDMAEKGITGGDSVALDLQGKARSLLEACKVNL
ncbi:MAG: hypothetical protein HWN70_06980 [Desulfobacterales bacterium]|nr:hypothetical protein [Desulfobacterales bacterium]